MSDRLKNEIYAEVQSLKEKISEKIKAAPQKAAFIIQSWIHQDVKKKTNE